MFYLNLHMLPTLPKQNKHREASFSLKFRQWIMENPQVSCTFEMKDTRGKDYLSFGEVTDQQKVYGLAVRSDRGVLIRVQGLNGEPDYSYHRKDPAFIVIKYPSFFCLIDIEAFVNERDTSKRKSLTSAKARAIAEIIV